MKPYSVSEGPIESVRSRLIVVLLALLAAGALVSFAFRPVRAHAILLLQAASKGKIAAAATPRILPPKLTVATEGSFDYEAFAQMFSGTMPVGPNTWHLVSNLTNNSPGAVEVVPIYLYSEASPSDPNGFWNTATICPKSYLQDFSADAQKGLTAAPEDLSGTLNTGVALPMEQMDTFPKISGSLPAMISERSFDAAITVDTKPAGWASVKIGPSSAMTMKWEFASIWASPGKVRLDPAFEIVFAGPIVRPAEGTHGKSYLVVAKLSAANEAGKDTIKQTSFELLAITPTLPQDLGKAFPGNRGALTDFSDAAVKIAAGP
jgi:hypothetical protein